MIATFLLIFCALWFSARADQCLAYTGNSGQYWLLCSSRDRSGAINECNLRQTQFATTDDDPSLPLVNVLDQLKYVASPVSQVQEYFKMFAASYSSLLNQRLANFDQLASNVIIAYELTSPEIISLFNSFAAGKTGAELTELQSLNATMQSKLDTERTKMLNAIDQYKSNASAKMSSNVDNLEQICADTSAPAYNIGNYRYYLGDSLIRVGTDQDVISVDLVSFHDLTIVAENIFNSAVSSITSNYGTFSTLEGEVQSSFNNLVFMLQYVKDEASNLGLTTSNSVRNRLQEATNPINSDLNLL